MLADLNASESILEDLSEQLKDAQQRRANIITQSGEALGLEKVIILIHKGACTNHKLIYTKLNRLKGSK